MRVLSLFAGIGGFDLGLERAGHEVVAQVELDKKCQAVLDRHWPGVPRHDDVSTYTDPPRVDLVVGGFPCQDLSVAGRRVGLAGERSSLFFDAARVADRALGAGGWLLLENVPGLLSSQHGRDFGIILATLADLGFHDCAWRVLDSRFFGVAQRRRRVFILARRGTGRRAAEVLLEPEGSSGDNQEGTPPGKEAAPPSSSSVAGSLGSLTGGFRTTDLDGQGAFITDTVTSKWSKGSGGPSGDECQNLVTSGSERESAGRGSRDQLRPAALNKGGQARAGAGGHEGRADRPALDSYGVRETSRVPRRVDNPVGTCPMEPKPDGARYAQAGNAVTVNVAEWLGRRLAGAA